jgi:hypothetical protein
MSAIWTARVRSAVDGTSSDGEEENRASMFGFVRRGG